MDKKNLLKYLIIGIGSFLGIIFLAFIYLYMSSFDIDYELKTFDAYINEENPGNIILDENNILTLEVPKDVVNTEILMILNNTLSLSKYKINNIFIDSPKKSININGNLYGIRFPISMAFDLTNDGRKIILDLGNISIGKHNIPISGKRSNKLKGKIFNDKLPIIIDTSSYTNSDLISIQEIILEDDIFKFYTSINSKVVKQDIKKIKDSANQEIIKLFLKSKEEDEKKSIAYILKIEDLTEEEIQNLIGEILINKKILKNILILAEDEILNNAFEKYEKIFKAEEKDLIIKKRAEILSEILLGYSSLINNELDENYFLLEPMYINKGQPYSLIRNDYITVQDIIKEQELNIGEETYRKLNFSYDRSNKFLLLSYKLNQDTYLLTNNETVLTLTEEEYKKQFTYEPTGRVSKVNDGYIWESIEEEIKDYFQSERIFIRYLKADDKYAFAVASANYDYQNIKTFALEKKNNGWQIIEEDIKKIIDLNNNHLDFNLELSTNEIEKVNFYHLGESMYNVILEDLVYKGIINNKEDFSIDYCSYGNEYIAILLSNGKEYVYEVYSMYLKTVLDKETAIETWDDLPEIITLQEKPQF